LIIIVLRNNKDEKKTIAEIKKYNEFLKKNLKEIKIYIIFWLKKLFIFILLNKKLIRIKIDIVSEIKIICNIDFKEKSEKYKVKYIVKKIYTIEIMIDEIV
jgi:hypothetical protein